MKVRHKLLERVGPDKGRFECPEGHRFVLPLITAKQRRLGRFGEASYRMLASWWGRTGVTMECPKCKRIAKQKAAERGRR